MALKNTDVSLATRLSQFGAVVGNCEITDQDGADSALERGIETAMMMLADARNNRRSVYVVGNGGSAGVAGHAITDFINVAKLRAFTLHDAPLLTCMANDFGYENAFAQALSTLAQPKDVLIAISSSGKSLNIRNAVAKMRELGGSAITLSGFAADNPLRVLGNMNIWLDSQDYGMVEIGHQFILHNIADRFRLGQAD